MATCRTAARKLRDALASLSLDTPTGKVSLDKNRNAIADIFLTEVAQKRRTARSTTSSSRSFRRSTRRWAFRKPSS